MRNKVTEVAVMRLRTVAQQEKRDQFIWDTELRGFGAKASAKGTVSFVVQRYHGRSTRVTLGRWPWLKIKRAREDASTIIGDLYRAARYPSVVVPQIGKLTTNRLRDTFEEYCIKRYEPGHGVKRIKQIFSVDIEPHLGKNRFIRDIAKADIRAIIDAKQKTAPAMARTLYAICNPFFDYCVKQDIIAVSPMASLDKPRAGKARDRYFTDAEILSYWRAAETLGYPYGPFYQLALLTAQRNETEVGEWQWSEISDGVWTIPSTRAKNKKEHLVHLSPFAMSIIDALPRKSKYLFTAPKGGMITRFSSYKTTLDRLMGVGDWTPHDHRRTMSTVMAGKLKIDSKIADRILNHVAKDAAGVQGVYQKYEFAEERKEAIFKWSDYVEQLISNSK